jgi:hypothetical protein
LLSILTSIFTMPGTANFTNPKEKEAKNKKNAFEKTVES